MVEVALGRLKLMVKLLTIFCRRLKTFQRDKSRQNKNDDDDAGSRNEGVESEKCFKQYLPDAVRYGENNSLAA